MESIIDNLLPYLLITIIIGGHEPQWVEGVLARVNALDDEILAVIIGYMIMVAREELTKN